MRQKLKKPEPEHLDVLNVTEAARFMGVSVDFLNRRRMRGSEVQGPPFMRVGRSVRYRKEDLENWLATKVVNPIR